MSDDMLMHFSSNSSNQSDQSLPTKIAKLEARMAGKVSSVYPAPPVQLQQQQQKQPIWCSVSPGPRFGPPEELAESSDSDDDNGGGFLIQANTQKRWRLQENDNSAVFEHLETQTVNDGKQKIGETVETKVSTDANRRKQGRGRGHSNSSRGRGVRANDQMRSQSSVSAALPSNGQLENSCHKDSTAKEHFQNGDRTSLEEELTSLHAKVAALEDDLRKSCQEASNNHDLCHQLEKELKELKDLEQQMKPKRSKIILDLLISVSKAERQEARMKVRQDSLRLGSVGVIRAGTIISETWEDGQMLKDLNIHLRQLLETKEAVERQRKSLKKRQSDKGDGTDAELGAQEEDFLIQDEIFKSRLVSIKREEETILRERDRYELEKGRLIRELKRIRDEDGSRFNNFQILNHRYALLNLLGKGGFSEVYKAYDLVEHRYVACKLHGLNVQWSEDKKQSYIRHALREYNIHKTLVHNHIVQLWDIFEIDQNTFCTILEYCSGMTLNSLTTFRGIQTFGLWNLPLTLGFFFLSFTHFLISGKDLDAVLKATPVLPEREARIIIVQIFQGLVYLNKRAQKIIHYDLKPGNVLFDEFGIAKVTDFGLSKIVEEDVGSQGMELTSQGAGTYWYLPPECFELSKTPLISSKVDVWSAGVLFYQMLFGRRPFGHDQTQERILREDTIIKARRVEFPTKPTISNEAKVSLI
ncbi:PREDICTED: serine/threonine-protein kinase TOUSLED-like isoform X2 [Populus euphratica]|uniref:Serine/threonine-protein kinase TOUSLED-like isoform X2 n=1 Tax=Populus euphratica TaxID=75702 RepID=A0AAJ6T7I4_POPEU|nr:PREDICTED: serine/threonine-protein kinase TOUSLED-like isoform X2 [Populus euphratica]